MARQVDRQCGLAEPDDHRVPGVRILPAAMKEDHARWAVAELQRADRTAVDALDRRRGAGHAGLLGVFFEEGELRQSSQFVVDLGNRR